MQSSAYQEFGFGIARRLKELPPSEGKDLFQQFFEEYKKAPLFLVGFSGEDMSQLTKQDIDFNYLRMPYGHMILEFCEVDKILASTHVHLIFDLWEISTEEIYADIIIYSSGKNDLTQYSHLKEDWKKLISAAVGKEYARSMSTFLIRIDRTKNEYSRIQLSPTTFTCAHKNELITLPFQTHSPFLTMCSSDCNEKHTRCTSAKNAEKWDTSILAILSYINQPQNYEVTETPILTDKEKKQALKNKVYNFAKKGKHIILNYSQVKELIKATTNTNSKHNSLLPHSRRGHWRSLKADRYLQKKNIWVRPADVNKGMIWKSKKMIYEIIR